jgi:hypothetical protein
MQQAIRANSLCACLAFLGALAPLSEAVATRVIAPDISIDPTTKTLTNLRVSYVAHALAYGDSESAVDVVDWEPVNWLDSISRAGQVVADNTLSPPHHSEAEYRARATVGTLKAYTRAKVERTAPSARSTVYLQFVDLIQATHEGKLSVDLGVTATSITNQVHPLNDLVNAFSEARADFYVWPYSASFPKARELYDFTVYEAITWEHDKTIFEAPDNGLLFFPGDRYWVLGQLTVSSIARGGSIMQTAPPHTMETVADLYHTVHFVLEPDPSTPDVKFVSASGFNYAAPVPEPATWGLFLVGLWLVGAHFKRRNR